jgi:hypothetical protein
MAILATVEPRQSHLRVIFADETLLQGCHIGATFGEIAEIVQKFGAVRDSMPVAVDITIPMTPTTIVALKGTSQGTH